MQRGSTMFAENCFILKLIEMTKNIKHDRAALVNFFVLPKARFTFGTRSEIFSVVSTLKGGITSAPDIKLKDKRTFLVPSGSTSIETTRLAAAKLCTTMPRFGSVFPGGKGIPGAQKRNCCCSDLDLMFILAPKTFKNEINQKPTLT